MFKNTDFLCNELEENPIEFFLEHHLEVTECLTRIILGERYIVKILEALQTNHPQLPL